MKDGSEPRPPLAEIGVTLAGIALLAALVLAVPALRDAFSAAVHGDTAEVRDQLDSLGAGGPLLILGLALIHAVVFYPAEIVDAAAGFAYGFFPALALVDDRLAALGAALLRDRALGGAAAARPLARRRALRAHRGDDRARRRHPADRRAADPDRPLQPRLLRGRRRPRAALALRLDDRGRLPADHRALRLLRHPAREAQRSPTRSSSAPPPALLALLLGGHWVVRRQAARSRA